jgi:hypothetical protein
MTSNRERAGRDADASTWGGDSIRAVVMVMLSYLAFVLIPNTLLGYLTTRMTPVGRDLVVTGFWTLAFLIVCVVFVRLQQRGKA